MLLAVPCSDADCLALLDAADGADRGRVGVGAHPVHAAVVDGRVFVATMGDRAVSVVADGEVRRVATGVLGPSHFATTDAGDVLVPCTGGDALAIVDADRLELRARVGVGAEPHDVAVHEGRAFVGSRADGTVTVVDPAAATVEATHDLAADARIQGVEAAAEGVYAVDQRNARLHRLTAAGVEGSVPTGENPYDAVVDDARVLVAGRDDGTVTAVSRTAGFGTDTGGDSPSPTRRVHDVGGRPSGVVVADGTAWVLDRERPHLASLPAAAFGDDGSGADAPATRRIEVPHPTFAAGVAPNDAVVYVSHYDDAAVSAVDLDAGRVAWTAATPARPFDPVVV
jgi:outer membrane protein assembly factor BamB